MEIIAGILTDSPQTLSETMQMSEELSCRVHIDIIDGVFIDNKTVNLDTVAIAESSAFLDIHLMTQEPVFFVERARDTAAERIIGHIEMMRDQREFVEKVIESGSGAGLALDIETPLTKLDPSLLFSLDLVLIMGVKAGFSGQEFNYPALDKIRQLSALRDPVKKQFLICVDGGVNPSNIREIRDVGADEVVVASSLFKGDIFDNMGKLKEALG